MLETNDPIHIYGSRISYYTGKLEAYLRYRKLAYRLFPTVGNEKKLIAGAGVVQMPVVQLTDGRWMTDTTPMLAWLDKNQDGPSIYPQDPALNFIALLIEDYADEWLWRSAMHYRWTYRLDRQYASEILYTELIAGTLPLPRPLALHMLKRRQLGGFVRGDGVTKTSRAHADSTYLAALASLEGLLARNPFLLGNAPTIADFGMMAPMFRHFGQDPTPSEIMRNTAPNVFAWVARMWTLNDTPSAPHYIAPSDPALLTFLTEICATHLAQLLQNADAYSAQQARYDLHIQGVCYQKVPSSRYRVWCLEQLRAAYRACDAAAQAEIQSLLAPMPEASILWDESAFTASDYDPEGHAPFNRAINVFTGGAPKR